MLFFIASFFGTFYDQKLFMLYILYYFMQNSTLENVFKAITFNLKQLFSVGLLGIVFVYVFCLIFYETYALELVAEKDPN
jgi:inositol 1,4,5-triphosphate receptor type 1/inositol 1,4,5-triphosphate receptor type 3